MRAVVVDPGLDQAVEVPMNQSRPVAAPPAWIDDDRLVLITATSEGTDAVIVDSASQGYEPGPSGVQLVATSADAGTAAVWRGPGRPVEIQSTTSWLAEEPAGVEIAPDGAAMPMVLALDASGIDWRSCGATTRERRPASPLTPPPGSGRGSRHSTLAKRTRRRWPGSAEADHGLQTCRGPALGRACGLISVGPSGPQLRR